MTVTNQVCNECCNVIEEMLEKLDVCYTKGYQRLYGKCPVHCGDNPAAWNLYPDGDDVKGYWKCYTHGCEKKFGSNLVGFVRGVLTQKQGKNVSWQEAILWMAKFLGYSSLSDVQLPSIMAVSRAKYDKVQRRLNIAPHTSSDKTWSPEKYRKQMIIPSNYYLGRHVKKDTLVKYDVGDGKKTSRAVVPVYNLCYNTIVGMSARSHFDKCPLCKLYHHKAEKCPDTPDSQSSCSKWQNSPGFEAAHHLYNLWFAQKHIIENNTVVIVEGPGDVWRLEESGIHNSVALFGTSITEPQLVLLERCQCMNAIVLMDNDKAGIEAAINIKQQLRRLYRLYFPKINSKDVGELTTDEITQDIRPLIEKVKGL